MATTLSNQSHNPASGKDSNALVSTTMSSEEEKTSGSETAGSEPATKHDMEYPSGIKLGLIILALCLSVFLIALDNAIIATAIPKISDEFNSLPDVGWYGSAYLLTTASLQLLFGKFYTYMKIKIVYLAAICLFELGSLICGVAQNSVTLILGRAIAGLGAAGIMSGALLILAHSIPLEKRPMYAGMIGSMYGIASVAGPWCFFINLPIGAITVAVITFFFETSKENTTNTKNDTLVQYIMRFDPIGNLLFMPAVICLLLALQWGGTLYPWHDGRIIALFVVFGVLLVLFCAAQLRLKENATIPPRIIGNRTVWASALYIFFLGSAFYLMVYYVPIWFQTVQGVSAIDSGIRNLPVLITVVIFSILAGAAVTAVGYYSPLMVAGTVLMSTGAGLFYTFTPDVKPAGWIGYQVLFGAGVGMGMQQPLMSIQNVLPLKDIATGTSIITFLQTLGGAIFVGVAQSVFTNQLVQSIAANVPGLNPRIVLATGATSLRNSLNPEDYAGLREAYNTALLKAFLVATGLSVASIFGSATIPWKSVKKGKANATQGNSA
ncbi:major facilitator superfamily transporter [Apiospora rasikravindrae]|uniref:Major facilitator superfamily transporter n=1 Tax=Apiospora rasikravindrae TaxID=990691 RepID=A0ABR1RP15_9PEZI